MEEKPRPKQISGQSKHSAVVVAKPSRPRVITTSDIPIFVGRIDPVIPPRPVSRKRAQGR
jgi:hypothetical protein